MRFPDKIDTLKAVKELLGYKGDTRLCGLTIVNNNPSRSQVYMGKNQNYSLQIEALYLINQLIYKEPFNYSSMPLLYDRNTHKIFTVSGTGVSKAFAAYEKWYKKMKTIGIAQIQKTSIMPLDESSVRWY